MAGADGVGNVWNKDRVAGVGVILTIILAVLGINIALPAIRNNFGVIPAIVIIVALLLLLIGEGAYSLLERSRAETEQVAAEKSIRSHVPLNREGLIYAINAFRLAAIERITMHDALIRQHEALPDVPFPEFADRSAQKAYEDARNQFDTQIDIAGPPFRQVLWLHKTDLEMAVIQFVHDYADASYHDMRRHIVAEAETMIRELDEGKLYLEG